MSAQLSSFQAGTDAFAGISGGVFPLLGWTIGARMFTGLIYQSSRICTFSFSRLRTYCYLLL